MTYFFDPESRTAKELLPGVAVRTFWGERMLASLVDLEADAVIPAHSHPHEQFGMLIRGEMQVNIGGETRTVKAGGIYIVPGGVVHNVHVSAAGAQAIEAFSPVREEYKFPD
jgi:quercetin dioxygenase-like cupin family protein